MELTKKEKGLILGLSILVLALIGVFVGVLTSPEKSGDTEVGILAPIESVDPEIVGENPDKSSPYYEEEFDGTLEKTVLRYASLGNFSALESYLANYKESHRNDRTNENIPVDYDTLIDHYILDIESIKALERKNYNPIMESSYNTPELCAAAYLYLPISRKIDGVQFESSKILPKVEEKPLEVSLSQVELTPTEYKDLVEDINLRKSDENRILDLKVYTAHAFGHDCKIYVVMQSNYLWTVYNMEFSEDSVSSPTVKDLREYEKQYASRYLSFDYDAFYTAKE